MNEGIIKVKIHSIVDVITNSSTTIFTNSDNCITPAKEMITEFFKAFGIDKNVDDVFAFGVFMDDYEYMEEECECSEDCHCGYMTARSLKWEDRSAFFANLYKDIAMGNVEKPEFMKNAEQNNDEVESTLYIYPKSEEYTALGEAIKKFLYSTSSDASYNG